MRKAAGVRLTAKEQAMSELQRKANEVQSRFSLSGYYKSQVKDPTPEMLAEMKSVVDPETGEVVKAKRTRRVAKKDGEEKVGGEGGVREKKAGEKTGEKEKAKGRGRKRKEEMVLESDSESEPVELTDSESEDDVIRDNRAALAARRSQEAEETPVKRKSVKRVIETPKETPKKSPAKTASKKSPVKETPKKSPVKETPKKSPLKETPKKSPVKESPKKSPAKAASKKSPVKTTPKKPVTESPTKKAPVTISDDSDEDTYIPLGERLKMKMQNDQRSSIVDELANTKSSVPASKRRRVTKKTTEEAKKPAKRPARKAAKKKDDSDDSDDSLFGF